MNGAQAVLESLKRENVEVIFGYPGGAVLDLYDALYKKPATPCLVCRFFYTFAVSSAVACRLSASARGKSGQRRAPYFLTGSHSRGWSSVTENNRHRLVVRVKRWGKSPPGAMAT